MNHVGVQSYTSWDQGFNATVETLTGNKARERGYTDIVDAIKKGNKEAILTAVNNSAWRTGKTGGHGAYKGMLGSEGGDYGQGPGKGPGSKETDDGKFSMASFLKSTNPGASLLSSFVKDFINPAGAAMTPGSATYNYGGVTINLSGGGSPEANVAALKAALTNQETISKAAGS
jgi:hypothetical protein